MAVNLSIADSLVDTLWLIQLRISLCRVVGGFGFGDFSGVGGG